MIRGYKQEFSVMKDVSLLWHPFVEKNWTEIQRGMKNENNWNAIFGVYYAFIRLWQ